MSAASYFEYWGKARPASLDGGSDHHPLVYHSLDVSAVAEVLLSQHPKLVSALGEPLGLSPDIFRAWFVYFLALHDVGKFAQSFQSLAGDVFTRLQQKTPTKVYDSHNRLGSVPLSRTLTKEVTMTQRSVYVQTKKFQSRVQA